MGGNLIAFNDNFADNSTEAGFQFTFFCNNCREGYKTRFIESRTYKKRSFFKGLGDVLGVVSQLTGRDLGGLERGSDVISERFGGMSPDWHKEHEAAFEMAQNDAKGHFKRCPKCGQWVCDSCWNGQAGLCVTDAPRENVEVAAARSKKMVQDIEAAAQSTPVFTGRIDARQTICAKCGKPAGEGKFCGNCGAPLGMPKCPKCGAENQPGMNFCGGCGARL